MIQTQPSFAAPILDNTGPLTASAIEDALAIDDTSENIEDKSDDKEEEKIVSDFDFSLLSDKDDKDDKDEELDDKDEKSEDDKEEDRELKLDEDNEDELELSRIPKRQEIKAAYPDIFKKFPALDHIIQREHAFAEVFPSIADAKSAKESVEQFNYFQRELLNGDIEGVLKSVKTVNPKAFDKITAGLLDSLVKIDPNSHLGITHQVSKGVLNYIHSAATNTLKKNPEDKRAQQLQIASELIHEALYDSSEVTPFKGVKTEEEINPELAKLNTERQQFERTRYEVAFNTVSSKMNIVLTNAVTRDIDTKNILPPYVKHNVIRDVMSELDRQLVGDTRFRGLIDKLWLKARESSYSDTALNNIQTALKEKAKTILPGIMRAKKGEAMKGLTSHRDDKRELPRNDKEELRAPRKETTLNRRDSDRNVPRQGESNLDFLMRD